MTRPCDNCLMHSVFQDRYVCGADKFLLNNVKVYSRKYRDKEGILFVSGIPEDVKCHPQMTQRERLKMKDARRMTVEDEF